MCDFAAEKLLVAIERCDHILDAAAAERHHIDCCELEVRRHPHLGHRDDLTLERQVVHAALRQNIRNGVTHEFADA